MFIKFNDAEFAVDFEYDRTVPNQQLTHCTVGSVTTHEYDKKGRTSRIELIILGYGTSSCHRNDTFKKAVGRKIALQRALVDAGFTKDDRRVFFEEYFKQAKK